jgi:hypothetical protein
LSATCGRAPLLVPILLAALRYRSFGVCFSVRKQGSALL